MNDRRGTFTLKGKRYSYHADVVGPSSPSAGQWQINVHSDGMLPDAFKLGPTFDAALKMAKDHIRAKAA